MTIRISRSVARGLSRRRFLSTAAATGAGALGAIAMPYLSRAADRPQITPWRAIRRRRRRWRRGVGARGPAVADDGRGRHHRIVRTMRGSCRRSRRCPRATSPRKCCLENLPAGQDIFYRVKFRDLSHTDISSEPVVGRFRTAPADRRDVSFVWGGDVAGPRLGHQSRRWRHVHLRHHDASTGRISCCIPATPSMPTASFPPR